MKRAWAGLAFLALLALAPAGASAAALPAPHTLAVTVRTAPGGVVAASTAVTQPALPAAHGLAVTVRRAWPARSAQGSKAAGAPLLPAPHSLTTTVRRLAGGKEIGLAARHGLGLPGAHALEVRVTRRFGTAGRKPVVKVVRVIPQSGVNPFDAANPIGGKPKTQAPAFAQTPAVPACNAGPVAYSQVAFDVTFYYDPTTGSCVLTPQPFGQAPVVFSVTQPGNPNVLPSGALLMGSDLGPQSPFPVWSLVSASAGTVTPGTFGQITNLPVGVPVAFVVQCVRNCTGTHPGAYSGTLIITNTTVQVQGLQ